jgi:hypothetical protein
VIAAFTAGGAALSSQALPGSPPYFLRGFGEYFRLVIAGAPGRVELRQQFAADRVAQALALLRQNRWQPAYQLIGDARDYIFLAEKDMVVLRPGEVDGHPDQLTALRAEVEREQEYARAEEAGQQPSLQ